MRQMGRMSDDKKEERGRVKERVGIEINVWMISLSTFQL